MAISQIIGFELGSAGEAYLLNGSTVTVQSTTARSGTYALRSNSTGQNAHLELDSRAAGGTFRNLYKSIRFYLRVGALPSSLNTECDIVETALAGSFACRLRLNPAGTLSLMSSSTVRATSTSALTADGLWHRVDFDLGWNSGGGMRVFVDGTQWASDTTDTTVSVASSAHIGITGANNASACDVYIDDVLCYDSALPATLSDYNVSLLRPTADSARGGWITGAAGTTNLWDALDNTPPAGTVTGSQTATSTIKNAVSSATDNYDATCAAYTTITGLTAQTQILGVQAVCNDAQEVTTGSPKAGAVVITSNPTGQTENTFDYGLPNGTAGSTTAAAVGAFPTGWGTHWGPVTETPTVTISSGPVARVGKRTATTRVVDVDALGVYVAWTPAATSTPVPKVYANTATAVNRAAIY